MDRINFLREFGFNYQTFLLCLILNSAVLMMWMAPSPASRGAKKGQTSKNEAAHGLRAACHASRTQQHIDRDWRFFGEQEFSVI